MIVVESIAELERPARTVTKATNASAITDKPELIAPVLLSAPLSTKIRQLLSHAQAAR
jgi:hypothetical protein